MSVYNPGIPIATDFLSDSQQHILNNFQQLDTSFGLNHFLFSDDTASNGKHKYIEMVNEAVLPVGLADEEGTIYTKKQNMESQMFFSPDDTGREYQMTKVIEAQFAKFGTNTAYSGTLVGGWTFLPGGLLLQYGKVPSGAPNPAVVTFPVEFPTAVFSITATGQTIGIIRNVMVQSFTKTAFNLSRESNVSAFWMAIGN